MTLVVRPFEPGDAERWDTFCEGAFAATLLHTRRFLSYHGDRFADRSLVIEEDGRWLGVLPAALHPADAGLVVSHPGITYGGVLHTGALRGERMLEALAAVRAHYAGGGARQLLYKAVPVFYHRAPAADDLYALFRLGAVRTRCDLSATIDLAHRLPVSERRRRSLKKAHKAGLTVRSNPADLPGLWAVLTENLASKHGVAPVHSIAEMQLLMERFPRNIELVCAVHGAEAGAEAGVEILAGVVQFLTEGVAHAQYIAASAAGYQVNALDAVFEHCIAAATTAGRRWFDFGISTEEGGMQLNASLYQFKTEFGGGGTVHEFYQLDL